MMNRLIYEKSPYLKQHEKNPIHWFAWGKEAFEKASEENKPVFLSIGYATCHWCHVMERESFEHQNVADILNKDFVSIKVDREEHPDVDQIYMDALLGMAGHGGWPMSMFLTPKGEPFFGGTYFPQKNFIALLTRISEAWKTRQEDIFETGKEYKAYLSQKSETLEKLNVEKTFDNFIKIFKHSFDPINGGRRGAPKFPNFYDLRVIMHEGKKINELTSFIDKNLGGILSGGIYDHVGGGLARYSTDEKWLVPHFEKMLYDQASLLWALAEAYQLTKNESYKFFIEKTHSYLFRDLCHKEGAFFSAEDADSEGVEGKFYIWPPEELKRNLSPEEFSVLSSLFVLNNDTLFEGGWILSTPQEKLKEISDPKVQSILEKLRLAREKRKRPLRDEKVLSSWNGLICSALIRSGFAIQSPKSIEKAEKALEFIYKNLIPENGKILRRWVEGEAKLDGTLEDYAFVIQASLDAYEFTGKEVYLERAEMLQAKQDELFWSETDKSYFLTEVDPLLIRRTIEFHDSVTPSGASVAFLNLQRMFWITENPNYEKRYQSMISALPAQFESMPQAFSYWLLGVDILANQAKVLSLKGFSKEDLLSLSHYYEPNLVIKWARQNGSDHKEAILCWRQSCSVPMKDLSQVF